MLTLHRNNPHRSLVQLTMDEELDAVAAAVPALRECAHHARVTLRDAIGNAPGQPYDYRWVVAHDAVTALLDRAAALPSHALPTLRRLRAFVVENGDLARSA